MLFQSCMTFCSSVEHKQKQLFIYNDNIQWPAAVKLKKQHKSSSYDCVLFSNTSDIIQALSKENVSEYDFRRLKMLFTSHMDYFYYSFIVCKREYWTFCSMTSYLK